MDQITPESRFADVWLDGDAGDLAEAAARDTNLADWPNAKRIEQKIPIYCGLTVRKAAADPAWRKALMAEWATLLNTGPGVLAITDAVPQDVVHDASALFERLIEVERSTEQGGGDHFAKPGANDRLWNSAEKHCAADPDSFARYFASDAIALVAEAWLGPGYQITAQINRVNPGGAAQTPHRDYHLGFMDPAYAARWPAHAHRLSPALTLQGAVAHSDMPVESGPTMLLPHSQTVENGYLSFGSDAAQRIFAEQHAQLALSVGDSVFFNPALMHGAGTNRTQDLRRMANLMQIGSAFGRSIETVDRAAMCRALLPILPGTLTPQEVENVIAASAEGYAYPTNLDNDPPVGGLAPRSQADLFREAIAQSIDAAAFDATLSAWAGRRES